jgi:hypothetical protein
MSNGKKSSEKQSVVAKYGLEEFGELKTSTSTIMVYTNVVFDLAKLFFSIKLTKIDVPLTKKQKNVDKKKIKAPYGSVIFLQLGNEFRGVDLRKKKKRWCTVCRPVKPDGKETKILTITERAELINEEESRYAIIYDCSKCQRSYRPDEQNKINHFLNQLTIVTGIGEDQPLLNNMMFKDSIKFAGCKNPDDAFETILFLWQVYFFKIPGSWRLLKGATTPRFILDVAMKNVVFKLGFPIERDNLNTLMNNPRYRKYITISQYESTGQSNVNIKMCSVKPENMIYDCLLIPLDPLKNPFFIKVPSIPYKKKKELFKDITFIVFSSSQIILTGKFDENMKEMYEFFVSTVFKHKDMIEEKIIEPDKKQIEMIKSQSEFKDE